MRRAVVFLAWALFVGACAPTSQDRVAEFNDDGIHLFQRGDYTHARETFQAALALQPGDANLLYNLAQCHERLDQDTLAEKTYRDCLTRSPNQLECRYALTRLLVRDGRCAEAVQQTQEWLTREPRLAGPYAIDGWLWLQDGDLPRAQGRFQQALSFDSNNLLALNELAHTYELLNRPERALALYEKALDVKPDQPEVRTRLASLRKEGAGRPRPD